MQFLHQTPEIAGLLYKRRGGFGKFAPNAWQYRFFAISKEGVLLYFDTETQDVEHLDSKARGRLDLRSVMYDVSIEPIEGSPTPYAIQLFVPNEEKWKLCADTKEDQARWCKVLNKFVNQEAKNNLGRGVISYTSDDEVDRPNREAAAAARRNTVAVVTSSSSSMNHDATAGTRPLSAPTAATGATASTTTTANRPSVSHITPTAAAAAAKKKAKLSSSSAAKTKDNDQFELVLVLLIINICFVGIYLASSIISAAFYVFLGNLVMGVTLQLRAARSRPLAAAAAGSIILREDSSSSHDTVTAAASTVTTAAMHAESIAADTTTTTVRSRGASGHDEHSISTAAAADRAVINNMASMSSDLGGGISGGVLVSSSGKPIAGATYPEVKTDFRTAPPHTWTKIDSSFFNVRIGPDYNRNKKKAPSGPPLYEPFAVDIFCAKTRVDHAASRFQLPDTSSIDSVLPAHIPAIMVVQMQIPSEPPAMFSFAEDGPGWALLMYFMITEETRKQLLDMNAASPAVKLWSEWCEKAPTDKDMRARFKVINSCTNMEQLGFSSLIVSYNAKPILIRRTGSLFRGTNYMEFDIHVHKFQNMAKQGIHQISSLCGNMYMQVGFVIEGKEDKELPEAVFGCVAVNKPQESQADFIFDHE